MTLSFIKRIMEDNAYDVLFITSVNTAGEIFYAYLLIETGKVEELKRSLREEDTDLRKFGVILASGDGHEPSLKVKEYIDKKLYLRKNEQV